MYTTLFKTQFYSHRVIGDVVSYCYKSVGKALEYEPKAGTTFMPWAIFCQKNSNQYWTTSHSWLPVAPLVKTTLGKKIESKCSLTFATQAETNNQLVAKLFFDGGAHFAAYERS